MKKLILFAAIIGVISNSVAQNAANGEKTFKSICAACHTVGKGKLVGPDLSGVNGRRNQAWLLSFIKSSQSMVKKGDPVAVKLFNEFNKIPMPDQNLTDAQIKDVLAYIGSLSPKSATTPATPKTATTTQQPKATSPASQGAAGNPPNWVKADHEIKCVKSTKQIDPKTMANDPIWNKAVWQKLALSPQNVVYPNLPKQSVDEVAVKSAYFGKEVYFLVEWTDATKNTEVDADKFCDQLAIQLPLDPGNIPSYMMGNAGGRVHIVHWKSVWQVDVEKGFQDVHQKYPNMWVDVYPSMEYYPDKNQNVYAKDVTAEQMVDAGKTNTMPGTYSKNPMSQIKRTSTVEEASAEGFGTMATQQNQQAKGWAVWESGKWKACIVVPVNTEDKNKAKVKTKTKVAFAIWDGGNENIGGRKHFMPWVDLTLEP